MVSKGLLFCLIAVAVLLPVAIVLCVATGFLLAALQDAAAARLLNGLALFLGVGWVVGLVALVLVLGFDAAARTSPPDEPDIERE